MRPRPAGAGLEQAGSRLLDHLSHRVRRRAALLRHRVDRDRPVEHVARAELTLRIGDRVAALAHAEVKTDHLGRRRAEQRLDLGPLPEVERSFFLVLGVGGVGRAVGVLRRVEPAPGRLQIALDVVEDVERRVDEEEIAAQQMGLEQGGDELSLVVEHLLEVRHPPVGVHRVPMQPAAEVVVDAARPHLAQAVERHLERLAVAGSRVVAQQEPEHRRSRELGRLTEPSLPRIPARSQLPERAIERAGVELPRTVACAVRLRAQHFDDPLSGVQHLVALLHPGAVELAHQVGEAGTSVARVRRVVGTGVERMEIGREPHRQRPAAAPGQRLHRRHVHAIDVGTLLAVDLDVDEELVHDRRDGGVLERLALHDVAPVAGRIADREEDRLVLRPCPLERGVTPGVPIDRVPGVLLEVGTLLVDQAVGPPAPAVAAAVLATA